MSTVKFNTVNEAGQDTGNILNIVKSITNPNNRRVFQAGFLSASGEVIADIQN